MVRNIASKVQGQRTGWHGVSLVERPLDVANGTRACGSRAHWTLPKSGAHTHLDHAQISLVDKADWRNNVDRAKILRPITWHEMHQPATTARKIFFWVG